MQRTHFDLLDIIRTDIARLEFPPSANAALEEHEATYKGTYATHDAQWFNSAANYLEATKRALQCKLRACEHVLVLGADEVTSEQRREAVGHLLDPSDAMALQHGVALVVKQGLVETHSAALEEVCESDHLAQLSLDLKGAQLTGPVPAVVLRICAQADFFDLSGNDFDIAEGSYLKYIVEHMHNLRNLKVADLRNRADIHGE